MIKCWILNNKTKQKLWSDDFKKTLLEQECLGSDWMYLSGYAEPDDTDGPDCLYSCPGGAVCVAL